MRRDGDRLYLLPAGAALSACGTLISQLAISARLFELDPSGALSARLVVLQLLGVALFGLLGGWILEKIPAGRAGIAAPGLAGFVSLALFLRGTPSAIECLGAAFIQSLAFGLEHPNLMRFLHSRLQGSERGKFFSLAQTAQQVSVLAAPPLAIALIRGLGIRWCFLVDACSYALSAAAWFGFRRDVAAGSAASVERTASIWDGYRVLFTDARIRGLGLFRIFNHFAYTTFSVAVPLWIAGIVSRTSGEPQDLQAASAVALALGTLGTSLLGGAALARRPHWVSYYPWISSLTGFWVIALLALHPSAGMLWLASLGMGIGQYFFRLTGIVIGAAVTPGESMASVIVAGDSLTRGVSFALGSLVPSIFVLSAGGHSIALFAGLALAAPWMCREAAGSVRRTPTEVAHAVP